MMHLLALLDCGTIGTRAEPVRRVSPESVNPYSNQCLAICGTHGTRRTHTVKWGQEHTQMARRLTNLADAWHERVAICLEADYIGEVEARSIADAEIGRRFVEMFWSGEVAA